MVLDESTREKAALKRKGGLGNEHVVSRQALKGGKSQLRTYRGLNFKGERKNNAKRGPSKKNGAKKKGQFCAAIGVGEGKTVCEASPWQIIPRVKGHCGKTTLGGKKGDAHGTADLLIAKLVSPYYDRSHKAKKHCQLGAKSHLGTLQGEKTHLSQTAEKENGEKQQPL